MTKGAGDQAVAEPEPERRRRPAEPKAEGVVPKARQRDALEATAHRRKVGIMGPSLGRERAEVPRLHPIVGSDGADNALQVVHAHGLCEMLSEAGIIGESFIAALAPAGLRNDW
jgi:hypothetical protein